MLVLERNVVGKLCYMSNMEKLVTSTHACVKEERNVAGKLCYLSIMKNWSPVLMLVLKRRIM